MDNNRRNKKHWNNNSFKKENKNFSDRNDTSIPEKIILNTPICPICSEAITEISSALSDPNTKEPIHFDCAIKLISEKESLTPNEKITYIGQGRFGVVHFDNPHDLRKFTILRIIDWENKEQQPSWRTEISDQFSQIK